MFHIIFHDLKIKEPYLNYRAPEHGELPTLSGVPLLSIWFGFLKPLRTFD